MLCSDSTKTLCKACFRTTPRRVVFVAWEGRVGCLRICSMRYYPCKGSSYFHWKDITLEILIGSPGLPLHNTLKMLGFSVWLLLGLGRERQLSFCSLLIVPVVVTFLRTSSWVKTLMAKSRLGNLADFLFAELFLESPCCSMASLLPGNAACTHFHHGRR